MMPVPRTTAALLALLVAIVAGIIASSVSGALKNTLVYAIFLPLPPLVSLLFFSRGSWLPLIFLELTVIVTLVGAGLVNYATEGKQKRYIKGAFKQYLSPAVIEQLISHPERLTGKPCSWSRATSSAAHRPTMSNTGHRPHPTH